MKEIYIYFKKKFTFIILLSINKDFFLIIFSIKENNFFLSSQFIFYSLFFIWNFSYYRTLISIF